MSVRQSIEAAVASLPLFLSLSFRPAVFLGVASKRLLPRDWPTSRRTHVRSRTYAHGGYVNSPQGLEKQLTHNQLFENIIKPVDFS